MHTTERSKSICFPPTAMYSAGSEVEVQFHLIQTLKYKTSNAHLKKNKTYKRKRPPILGAEFTHVNDPSCYSDPT